MTDMPLAPLPRLLLEPVIRRALDEDLGISFWLAMAIWADWKRKSHHA